MELILIYPRDWSDDLASNDGLDDWDSWERFLILGIL
jgi:hypothetical protein